MFFKRFFQFYQVSVGRSMLQRLLTGWVTSLTSIYARKPYSISSTHLWWWSFRGGCFQVYLNVSLLREPSARCCICKMYSQQRASTPIKISTEKLTLSPFQDHHSVLFWDTHFSHVTPPAILESALNFVPKLWIELKDLVSVLFSVKMAIFHKNQAKTLWNAKSYVLVFVCFWFAHVVLKSTYVQS